jgi:hypothetical protein
MYRETTKINRNVDSDCCLPIQRVASKVLLVSGSLTASQQKVSCSAQCETSSSFSDRSQPIETTPGLTPKYLPSPLPMSASRVPTGSPSKKSFTLCQYTLRRPRVWFQCTAMLSYTRTTWSSSSSPGCSNMGGSSPGFNAYKTQHNTTKHKERIHSLRFTNKTNKNIIAEVGLYFD